MTLPLETVPVAPVQAGEDFVARLRAERLRRRLTWAQYASLLGISEQGLYNIVYRRVTPRELTVENLCQRLGWR